MTFEVQPTDLSAFAKQLERASSDARHALDYTRRECSISPFDKGPISALASMFGGGHDGVLAHVESTLKQLQRILDSSQREMERSASFYELTDQGEASKMDAIYPASKR